MSKFYCDHGDIRDEYTPILANNSIDEIGRLCLECGTDRELNQEARSIALMDAFRNEAEIKALLDEEEHGHTLIQIAEDKTCPRCESDLDTVKLGGRWLHPECTGVPFTGIMS